ncbi:MAG TPA: GNAT family N-acetyltransferase, partial [Gemmatimonadaceae bacterium]|nr:GNAT family N-acetyltransferase [Gemmatimonadaceae bacterium]
DTGDLAGIVLHGEVAGTRGTGALLWLSVRPSSRRRGVGRALLGAATGALRSGGARIVVAEVADSPEHQGLLALLRARGFVREGSVPDFYREGVALTLWVFRPG